jgi:ElaB/YqjD/DUF883 family membrane-anchored ribosome-binding protein
MQRTSTYPDTSAVRSSAEALSDKAHGGIDRLTSTAHDAVERATSAAATAADTLGVKGRELLDARDEWMDATRVYVREHPLAALGVALAAGYLLSRILSSR